MRRNERERIYQKKQKKEEQPKVNIRYTQREGRNERETNRKKNPRKNLKNPRKNLTDPTRTSKNLNPKIWTKCLK